MLNETQIDQAIAENKADFYHDLAKIMKIKSQKGPREENAPFGRYPRQVLEVIAGLSRSYGFDAKIVNNAMAVAQWGANDDRYIGVIDHLDVVPAGDNWESDPWSLTKKGDRFYGRGILDNKGPTMATLWAMKLLKELGYEPKNTIRLVYGSDEESGSQDVPMYLKDEKPPVFGWTADCKYPVVYGERGIVNYAILTPIDDGSLDQISDFKGDMAADHVPDELEVEVNGLKTTIKGRKSPSNAPELGKNAITLFAKKIVDEKLVSGDLFDYLNWLVTAMHEKHFGEGLGIAFEDKDSGKLILTPTGIQKEKNGIRLDLAFRYPVSFSEDQITDGLTKQLPRRSKLEIIRSIPSVMHDKQSKYVRVLSQIYEEVTGLDGTPVTTTGATYARVMPNIVAFGPSFPGQKGIAHKENEWMAEKDLLVNMKIALLALMRLGDIAL